jgi:hypothetical protein
MVLSHSLDGWASSMLAEGQRSWTAVGATIDVATMAGATWVMEGRRR